MKILITGGAGHVGRKLRGELAGRYQFRVMDTQPVADLRPGEEAVQADITDLAAVEKAMEGTDGCIHLAAIPIEAPWEDMLPVNIAGTANIYEAARRKGVRRIVFGSSNHAVGFYPRSQTIDEKVPPRPDSRYGLSKCWGEAVGALYADKYDVRSLHIRIGNAADVPGTKRALSLWVSGRDLAQLVVIGFEHPAIRNDIVYGISNNAAGWYDNSHAFSLGYKPQDRAEDHTAAAMEGEKTVDQDPVALHFQGGPFCTIEYAGPDFPRKG